VSSVLELMKFITPQYLDTADVLRDVEKVRFSKNWQNFGDRKCLPKVRTSLVGLPNAKFF